MSRWGRPSGIREKRDPGFAGISKCCYWHQTGAPEYAMGKAWRSPNCVKCDEKLVAGLVTAYAPTPEQLLEQHKAEGRKKGRRASVCARRTSARAAMTKSFHENLPGRECR